MTLSELIAWLQSGNSVRGIPETDVDKCARGLLINITDMDDKQALKFALGHTPVFDDCIVVKIGIPTPEPIKKKPKPKPKKTIAEATSKTAKKTTKKKKAKDGK